MKIHPHATYRASFTFPAPLAKDLTYTAQRLGVSQSALLVELLSQPITYMADLMRSLPEFEVPTEEQVKRARGDSVAVIRERIAEARAMIADVEEACGK